MKNKTTFWHELRRSNIHLQRQRVPSQDPNSVLGSLGIPCLMLARTAWASSVSVSCRSLPVANSSHPEYLSLSAKTFFGFLSSGRSHWGNGWAGFHSSSCVIWSIYFVYVGRTYSLDLFFLENPKDLTFTGSRSHLENLKMSINVVWVVLELKNASKVIININSSSIRGCSPQNSGRKLIWHQGIRPTRVRRSHKVNICSVFDVELNLCVPFCLWDLSSRDVQSSYSRWRKVLQSQEYLLLVL